MQHGKCRISPGLCLTVMEVDHFLFQFGKLSLWFLNICKNGMEMENKKIKNHTFTSPVLPSIIVSYTIIPISFPIHLLLDLFLNSFLSFFSIPYFLASFPLFLSLTLVAFSTLPSYTYLLFSFYTQLVLSALPAFDSPLSYSN